MKDGNAKRHRSNGVIRDKRDRDRDADKRYGNRIRPSKAQRHFTAQSKVSDMIKTREMDPEERLALNIVRPFHQTLSVMPKACWVPLEDTHAPFKVDFSAPNFELTTLRGLEAVPPKRIHYIDLSGNKLKTLKLGNKYRNVRVMRAPDNTIHAVVLHCRNLQVLDLEDNKLHAIPDLEHMPLLTRLNLRLNNLHGDFHGLLLAPLLTCIDLSHNKFHFSRLEFEASLVALHTLAHLAHLVLRDNPLETTVEDFADLAIDTCTHLQSMDGVAVDMARLRYAMKRLAKRQTDVPLTPRPHRLSDAYASPPRARALAAGHAHGEAAGRAFGRDDSAAVAQAMDELSRDLATARSHLSDHPKPPKQTSFLSSSGDKTRPALITAAFLGHSDTVRQLCEAAPQQGQGTAQKKKSNVNVVDVQGRTAMMWAAIQGHCQCIHELVEVGGADVNARDNSKKSALMWAAMGGSSACVEMLLLFGAGVDMRDHRGRTALVHAATTAVTRTSPAVAVACVHLLLKAGSDATTRTKTGHTASDLARHPLVRAALCGGVSGAGGGRAQGLVDQADKRRQLQERKECLGAEPSEQQRAAFNAFLCDLASDTANEAFKEKLVRRLLPGDHSITSVQAMRVLSHFRHHKSRNKVLECLRPCLTDPHHLHDLLHPVPTPGETRTPCHIASSNERRKGAQGSKGTTERGEVTTLLAPASPRAQSTDTSPDPPPQATKQTQKQKQKQKKHKRTSGGAPDSTSTSTLTATSTHPMPRHPVKSSSRSRRARVDTAAGDSQL